MKDNPFNIYHWILSEEIREAFEKKPPLSIEEQAGIIYNGYRSVEEKLQACTCLLDQAVTKEEKERISQMILYYEFVIDQMKDRNRDSKGNLREIKEIWTAACRVYEYSEHYDYTNFYLFYSFEEAKRWADEYVEEACEVCCLQKWILGKEEPVKIMECSLRKAGEKLCVTHAYVDEKTGKEMVDWGTVNGDIWKDFFFDERLPYPLPFATGDLVKIDGPVFVNPLYGVWCTQEDGFGYRYNWMGCIEKEEEDIRYVTESMNYHQLNMNSELCVMDWLGRAQEEELPGVWQRLSQIGRELRELRKEGEKKAAKRFHEIFRQ